jgi:hypothetical protein
LLRFEVKIVDNPYSSREESGGEQKGDNEHERKREPRAFVFPVNDSFSSLFDSFDFHGDG